QLPSVHFSFSGFPPKETNLFSVKIPEQRQPIRDSVRSKLNTNLLIFQIYEKKHRMDSFL
ncbi:hypothetical protein, partial [Odoribacter splanchnicus]